MCTIARVVTWIAIFWVFAGFALSQSSQQDRSPLKNATTRSGTTAISNAVDRLKRELVEAPRKLGKNIVGNWSVVRFSLRKTKSAATPLNATVILNYDPLSILKYYRSYRCRITLELKHNTWQLVTAEEQSYFKDQPFSLETPNYRPLRSKPPGNGEFRALQSCFQ